MIPWLETVVTESAVRLLNLPPEHAAKQYLLARGVPETYQQAYRLGWLPEPTCVTSCTPACWDWLRKYGWSRIVFPLTDPLGQVVGLQVRSPEEKGYRDFMAQPTELCPPAFGLDTGLRAGFASGRLLLVEGVFDYFAVRPLAEDVVAILTGAVSLAMRRILTRYVQTVVCLTDMDAPGRRGAYRLAGLPVPSEFWVKPEDALNRVTPTPPYHVMIPTYSTHDLSDLLAAGKHTELQRLTSYGRLQAGCGHR